MPHLGRSFTLLWISLSREHEEQVVSYQFSVVSKAGCDLRYMLFLWCRLFLH